MLTLHLLEQSRALRIPWLLEILGADYTLQTYPRDPQTLLAPEALKRIHPLGKSPLLQDGSLTLAESGAITDYLIRSYGRGRLMPAEGTAQYWQYQRWLHYAEASLMPLLLLSLIFRKIETAPAPFFVKPISRKISAKVKASFIAPQTALHLSHIEQELSGKDWLMGELSGADIMMSYPLQAAESRFGLTGYPNLQAYLQRIAAHPAYRRAVAKAGEAVLRVD